MTKIIWLTPWSLNLILCIRIDLLCSKKVSESIHFEIERNVVLIGANLMSSAIELKEIRLLWTVIRNSMLIETNLYEKRRLDVKIAMLHIAGVAKDFGIYLTHISMAVISLKWVMQKYWMKSLASKPETLQRLFLFKNWLGKSINALSIAWIQTLLWLQRTFFN